MENAKDKWLNKYEDSQNEVNFMIKKIYNIKIYLMFFIFLSLFLLIFLLYLT
jgi:hypothetical protein